MSVTGNDKIRTWRRRRRGGSGSVGRAFQNVQWRGVDRGTPFDVISGNGRVCSRGKATQCLRKGLASIRSRWREEARGAGVSLIPEEFALQSGRIGGSNQTGREKSSRGND